MEKELIGVVVIGLGIAGKVRIRDLQEKSCPLTLKGFVSRRQVDIPDVPQLSLDEALNRDDVKAVVISTEPALHEEYTRKALEKGKHVLVDYPMALTAETARQLYKLAEDKGLILHEENIALLTNGYLAVKDKLQSQELKQASYSLTGSFNGWIEKFDSSGLPFITGVSGLQVMLSLFGDLTVKSGQMTSFSDGGYQAEATLETQAKSPITMTLARKTEAKRTKQVIFEFSDGEVIDTSKIAQNSKTGLFMQDLELFYQQVKSGSLPSESKWISIRSVEIAEQIHSFF